MNQHAIADLVVGFDAGNPKTSCWLIPVASAIANFMLRVECRGNVAIRSRLMTVQSFRYCKEEFARRGNEIYESQVRPQVEEGNHGKIVAIDIETGAFELANDTMTASDRLLERYPDAQIWCVRIGHKGVHRFGVGRLSS